MFSEKSMKFNVFFPLFNDRDTSLSINQQSRFSCITIFFKQQVYYERTRKLELFKNVDLV